MHLLYDVTLEPNITMHLLYDVTLEPNITRHFLYDLTLEPNFTMHLVRGAIVTMHLFWQKRHDISANCNKKTDCSVRVLYSDRRRDLSSASYHSNIFDLANHISRHRSKLDCPETTRNVLHIWLSQMDSQVALFHSLKQVHHKTMSSLYFHLTCIGSECESGGLLTSRSRNQEMASYASLRR